MHRHALRGIAIVMLAASLGGGASAQDARDSAKGSAAHIKAVTSAVDDAAIQNNAKTTKDWLSYGLDNAGTRYSRLDQINTGNVGKLAGRHRAGPAGFRGAPALAGRRARAA